ncbi:hypothetical protein LCGC14_1269620 [marine sediment metagenome]|uniref:Uncharacterized protein n=1 Tax=marine sediment metagenome TaxID=412755 RepID=A0A0F9P1N0_9ZZZZ
MKEKDDIKISSKPLDARKFYQIPMLWNDDETKWKHIIWVVNLKLVRKYISYNTQNRENVLKGELALKIDAEIIASLSGSILFWDSYRYEEKKFWENYGWLKKNFEQNGWIVKCEHNDRHGKVNFLFFISQEESRGEPILDRFGLLDI